MTDQNETSESVIPVVAPGYPAIETVKQIDVTGWEPAAIFSPITFSSAPDVEGAG